MRYRLKLCLILSLFFLLETGVIAQALPDFTQLVENNAPAVVNISTVSHAKNTAHKFHSQGNVPIPENSPFSELFRRYFEEGGSELPPEDSESLGSGFVISADGFVLTNRHVVDGADEIIVRLSNRKSYEAQVVGSDEASDIALLKIDAKNLPTVKLGSSKNLKIGAWVLAIGSPFGFEASVTAGIVSAKGRSLPFENYVPYIQTDVAINPGNSGGPLFDLQGQVVGINSQIFSRSGGFMGLSFAVPIELAMNVVEQLRKDGHVTRGYLGVLIQDIDQNLAESFGMSRPRGALVAKVMDSSPAARAGLRVGDVIVAYNDQILKDSTQLPPLVGTTPVGGDADLQVLRNGEELKLRVRIAELSSETTLVKPVQSKEVEAGKINKLGLVFFELSDEERENLGLGQDEGVGIKEVQPGAASIAGIQSGDVVLMVGGKKTSSVSQLEKLISAIPAGKSVAILLRKPQGPVFIALRLSDD